MFDNAPLAILLFRRFRLDVDWKEMGWLDPDPVIFVTHGRLSGSTVDCAYRGFLSQPW